MNPTVYQTVHQYKAAVILSCEINMLSEQTVIAWQFELGTFMK